LLQKDLSFPACINKLSAAKHLQKYGMERKILLDLATLVFSMRLEGVVEGNELISGDSMLKAERSYLSLLVGLLIPTVSQSVFLQQSFSALLQTDVNMSLKEVS